MRRARSTGHPILDLGSAYHILRNEFKELGSQKLDREGISSKLGYRAAGGGMAGRTVSSFVHYGLLDRRGHLYGLSPLGIRLQDLDLEDAEFPSAIRAALEHPTLFKAVLDAYREAGRIPKDLAQDLAIRGIAEGARPEAEKVFRNSALFAGVLDTEGRFQKAGTTDRQSASHEDAWYKLPLQLPNGGEGWIRVQPLKDREDLLALKEAFSLTCKILALHFGIDKGQVGHSQGKAEPAPSPISNVRSISDKKRPT